MTKQQLPPAWVDRIFEKLTLIYGRDFVNRWQSTGVPIEGVKADWGHELAGFINHPEAIAHALENLPSDKAPTVLQFRDMCRKAPPKPVPAIAYSASPMPDEVRQKLKELTNQMRMKP